MREEVNLRKIFYGVFLYSFRAFAYLPITFLKRVLLGRDNEAKRFFFDSWGYLDKRLLSAISGGKRVIWIDVASGGEILQIPAFLNKLKSRIEGLKIVLSTASDDAYKFAKKIDAVDFVFNTPWDISFVAKRAIKSIKPNIFMAVVFSRIPVHFKTAQECGVKTVLISGMMSCDWHKHPNMRRSVDLEYYRYFDFIGAKDEEDLREFIELGVCREKIAVLGNMKFDAENFMTTGKEVAEMRKAMGLKPEEKIFLSSSILPPEGDFTVQSYLQARAKIKNLRLVCVPRFIQHLSSITAVLNKYGLRYIFKSRKDVCAQSAGEVVIVDTFGELAKLYHLADFIFLSGSVSPKYRVASGKNIVEPLASGNPVFFGRFMQYWGSIVEELKLIYSGFEISTPEELAANMFEILNSPAIMDSYRVKAKEIIGRHVGVGSRYLAKMEELLILS